MRRPLAAGQKRQSPQRRRRPPFPGTFDPSRQAWFFQPDQIKAEERNQRNVCIVLVMQRELQKREERAAKTGRQSNDKQRKSLRLPAQGYDFVPALDDRIARPRSSAGFGRSFQSVTHHKLIGSAAKLFGFCLVFKMTHTSYSLS